MKTVKKNIVDPFRSVKYTNDSALIYLFDKLKKYPYILREIEWVSNMRGACSRAENASAAYDWLSALKASWRPPNHFIPEENASVAHPRYATWRYQVCHFYLLGWVARELMDGETKQEWWGGSDWGNVVKSY